MAIEVVVADTARLCYACDGDERVKLIRVERKTDDKLSTRTTVALCWDCRTLLRAALEQELVR